MCGRVRVHSHLYVCVCVTACLSVYVRGEGIEPDVYMNVCVCVGAYM